MASSISNQPFFPETQRRGLNEFPGANERAATIRAGKRKNRLALQRMADETALEKQEMDAEAATVLEQLKQQEETTRQQDEIESKKGYLSSLERYHNAMADKADRSVDEVKAPSLSDRQKLGENAKKHFMYNYGIDEVDGQLMPPAEGYTKEQLLEMQENARKSGLKIYPTALDESGERYTIRGIVPVYSQENSNASKGSGGQATNLADELESLRKQAAGSEENLNAMSDEEFVNTMNERNDNSSKSLQSLKESNQTPFSKTRLASLLGMHPYVQVAKGYRGAYRGLNKYGVQPAWKGLKYAGNWLMSPVDKESIFINS